MFLYNMGNNARNCVMMHRVVASNVIYSQQVFGKFFCRIRMSQVIILF